MVWRVAAASEFLVITGWGIDDIMLAKKAWILPGQSFSRMDLAPVNYDFDVQAMSAEKLPFKLPAVFTIGPRADDPEALIKYARLVNSQGRDSRNVNDLVKGIIEGETRVLAASMTMEEIFKGTKEFKSEVFGKVQLELNEFGLHIYNANVKQLVDIPGHEYFSFLGQKIQQEAANAAKVAVAEATYKGDVGAKQREGLTLQNAAKVDTETKVLSLKQQQYAKQQELQTLAETRVFENTRKAEIAMADAELTKKSAIWTQEAEVAKIQSVNAAKMREAELQRELQIRYAETEMERLRASEVVPATINYEKKVQDAKAQLVQRQQAAEAALFEQQRQSDAITYNAQRTAEARKQAADAEAYAIMKAADARLYETQRQAEGLIAMAEAKAAMVGKLLKQLGGDYRSLHDFLLLDRGIYQDMARLNAEAIKGLSPKISIWDTNSHPHGDGDENGLAGFSSNALGQFSHIYKSLPPLLTTVQEQTGITPSTFIATLP
ncbi:hypothetical protein KP509_35G062600 [Ceratopteris richardii]|uniref:Flotillin-like n=1 Tax=Ceratopteris richardii TaxID=49495 RepID=A0A8T2QHK1_CERRI|nr:hypothetical protein KP509_35G062600 [Ceratopteris richardii]